MNVAALGCLLALAAGAANPQPSSADAKAHMERAAAIRKQGDALKALGEYREAARLDPRIAAVHREIGLILLERRDFTSAATEFRNAVRLDPKFALAHARFSIAASEQARETGDKAWQQRACA